MKIYQLVFLGLTLTFGMLSAQQLDPQTYARLREYMVMTHHQTPDELRTKVDAVSQNPVPYLRALAEDATLRIYAKQKAISLLRFYQTPEAEAFLAGKVSDTSLHPSLRTHAVRSYAEGFYRQNPSKAEALLTPFENDRKIGPTVKRSLNQLRAGKAPDSLPQRNKHLEHRRGAERR